MAKTLSEMSLEELWRLFPIILCEHQAEWRTWYDDEEKRLSSLLTKEIYRISHIGSTAIKGIKAKPIIDILIEIPFNCTMERIKCVLLENGYLCMSEDTHRMSFNMGYTQYGFAKKVYHVHLRFERDCDELYFRDYLNDVPMLAKQYESLKSMLSKQYEFDRDAYTEAKGNFILEATLAAKTKYMNRY